MGRTDVLLLLSADVGLTLSLLLLLLLLSLRLYVDGLGGGRLCVLDGGSACLARLAGVSLDERLSFGLGGGTESLLVSTFRVLLGAATFFCLGPSEAHVRGPKTT